MTEKIPNAVTIEEAEELMKQGNTFTAVTWRSVTSFNKKLLKFYMVEYNYERTKCGRGIDIYKPQSND